MKLVVIESPYSGDIDKNIEYAKAAVRDCLSRGEAPIASHLLYTQSGLLDDNDFVQRQLGIEAGHAWLEVADTVVVYLDLGISSGMDSALKKAYRLGKSIEFRYLNKIDKS